MAKIIVKSGITNDPDGCQYLYTNNYYEASHIHVLIDTKYNLREENVIRFGSNLIKFDKKCMRGG